MIRRKGIYFLPNLFTTAALFFGFYSILLAVDANFAPAAGFLFIAIVIDGLDGRIARMTNTQSDFGEQYDSLADLVSFGLAPALLMHQWMLAQMGKLGSLACFVYATTAALRLARFNVQQAQLDKLFFQGLPSPAGAALLAGTVLVTEKYAAPGGLLILIFSFLLTLCASGLMVSAIRYHSCKQFDLKSRVPLLGIVAMMVVIAMIASNPSLFLFLLALLYAASGPVLTLVQLQQRHRARRRRAARQPGASRRK